MNPTKKKLNKNEYNPSDWDNSRSEVVTPEKRGGNALSVRIRRGNLEDYDDFLRLSELADEIHRQNLPKTFCLPVGPSRSKDYFARIVNDSDRLLWFAEVDGALAGFIVCRIEKSPYTPIHVPKTTLMIHNLVVDPTHRRSGVARLLHEEVIQYARSAGISELNLVVYAFNEGARAFYGNMGYATESLWMTRRLD